MEQLANSAIVSGAWGDQTKMFFMNSLDEAGQKIGQKLEQTDDVETAINKVVHGAYAYYENEYFLKKLRSMRASANERETLHIMEECAIHMPVSIGLQKNSPIKEIVDNILRNIIESGLASKWLRDGIHHFQSNVETAPQEALMDLPKMFGAFVALALGFSLACITLVGELCYFRFWTQKHPLYDRLIVGQYMGNGKN